MMRHAAPQALLAGNVPDLHHTISLATGQQPTGTEGDCPDLTALLLPYLDAAAIREIPEPDRSIITARRQQFACRMEGDRLDPFVMALQDTHTLPTADLPHLRQPIVAPAHQQRPLRMEGQRPGQPDMTLKS